MLFLRAGICVKVNNRRRDRIPTATCGGICRTVAPTNDFSRRCRYSSQIVIGQVND